MGLFAVGQAHFSRLDTMVHCVSHQVHQRIADLLHYGFVQFGLAATDDQVDVFSQFPTHITYDTVETVEGFTDLYHAQTQRTVADFFHQARYHGNRFNQFVIPTGVC